MWTGGRPTYTYDQKSQKQIYTFIKHKKTDSTGVKNTEEIWIHCHRPRTKD